jgi:hypothetical protein
MKGSLGFGDDGFDDADIALVVAMVTFGKEVEHFWIAVPSLAPILAVWSNWNRVIRLWARHMNKAA